MSFGSEEELKKLEFYEDKNVSLSVLYGLPAKMEKALSEKVWLDSGAYLVIQPTEALVSIDVNTGKAIAGKQNTEDTFFKVNCEAAEEIAAQLRLFCLGVQVSALPRPSSKAACWFWSLTFPVCGMGPL